METVDSAILSSISHDRIVTLEVSDREEFETLRKELFYRCDDGVRTSGSADSLLHEYWGTDDDGNEWRVHIELPTIDDYDDYELEDN